MTGQTPNLSDRLAACYTGVVHDVMRGMGLSDFTLPPELRPILPAQSLAGPAFTVEGQVVDGCDPHETLIAWTGTPVVGALRLGLGQPAERPGRRPHG